MVKATAYVKDGRLIVIGVAQLSIGAVPFSYDCTVPDGTPEGPFDMNSQGDEALEECLTKAELSIKHRIEKGAIRVGAENLVLRSRQGDQNAMAMLIAIRRSAKKGSRKARMSLKAIREYIEDHPPSETCQFGFEAKKAVSTALTTHVNNNPLHYTFGIINLLPHVDDDRGVVLVANGPLLDMELVSSIREQLSERDQRHFDSGFKGKLTASKAAALGNIFRRARELQAARRGMFHLCSPILQYELGD